MSILATPKTKTINGSSQATEDDFIIDGNLVANTIQAINIEANSIAANSITANSIIADEIVCDNIKTSYGASYTVNFDNIEQTINIDRMSYIGNDPLTATTWILPTNIEKLVAMIKTPALSSGLASSYPGFIWTIQVSYKNQWKDVGMFFSLENGEYAEFNDSYERELYLYPKYVTEPGQDLSSVDAKTPFKVVISPYENDKLQIKFPSSRTLQSLTEAIDREYPGETYQAGDLTCSFTIQVVA